MRNASELFVHELSDLYDGEQRLLQMLPMMADECGELPAGQALRHHALRKRQQLANIDRCFLDLGRSPNAVTCGGIEGIRQEHDAFLAKGPPAELLAAFDQSAAAKSAHYEIATYHTLIDLANLLGKQECSRLLEQNLNQEEEMARRAAEMGRLLTTRMVRQGAVPSLPGAG